MFDQPLRTSSRTALLAAATLVGALLFAAFETVATAFAGGRDGVPVLVLIAGMAVFRAVAELASWWSRTYTVRHTELILDEGVLARRKKVVPYARIQQIDLHRGLLSQVLGVAELRVETAGEGGATSIRLRYLTLPVAEALRGYVLSRRSQIRGEAPQGGVTPAAMYPPPPGVGQAPGTSAPQQAYPHQAYPQAYPQQAYPQAQQEVLVLRMTPEGLAMAALTHSSVVIGVPLFLVGGLWAGALVAAFGEDVGTVTAMGIALVAVAAGSVTLVVSRLANMLIGRYGFRVTAVGDDLHLRFGLLEVRNLTVPRRRIQHLTVVDNPVRRLVGGVSLTLHTAASGEQGGNQGATSFEIPLFPRTDLDSLLSRLMGTGDWALPAFERRGPAAARRAVVRRCLVLLVAMSVPAALLAPAGLVLLLAALLGVPWGRAAHKRAGRGRSASLVALAHGVLHHRVELVPLGRIQSARTSATPFQRRSDLATLHLDLAGSSRTPWLYDLEEEIASAARRELPRT